MIRYVFGAVALLLILSAFTSMTAEASWRPANGPASCNPYGPKPYYEVVIIEDVPGFRTFVDPEKTTTCQEVLDANGVSDYWISQFQGSDGNIYRIVWRLEDIGWPPVIEYHRTVEVKHPVTGEWHEVSSEYGEWRTLS